VKASRNHGDVRFGVDVNGGVSPLYDLIGAHVGVLFSLKCAPVLCVLFFAPYLQGKLHYPSLLGRFSFQQHYDRLRSCPGGLYLSSKGGIISRSLK
jgi:hypothetical protein